MAITNYSTLSTALQNWTARSDSTFTSRVDEFIALAEDRIHYGFGNEGEPFYSEPLRVRGMETTGDLTVSSQTVALPTGFLEHRRIYLNTDPKVDLDFMPPDRFWASSQNITNTSGKPSSFTIEGTNIIFGPSPDATYTGKFLYFAKLTGLSSDNATNWLITNSPGTYLYGCLTEAMIWDKNDDEATKYASLFRGRINALNRQDRRSRYGKTPLRQYVDRVA